MISFEGINEMNALYSEKNQQISEWMKTEKLYNCERVCRHRTDIRDSIKQLFSRHSKAKMG